MKETVGHPGRAADTPRILQGGEVGQVRDFIKRCRRPLGSHLPSGTGQPGAQPSACCRPAFRDTSTASAWQSLCAPHGFSGRRSLVATGRRPVHKPNQQQEETEGESTKINPTFPPSRLDDPTRQAERAIYQLLQEAEVAGRALYESKPKAGRPQVDFTVLAEGRSHYGIQAKGGQHLQAKGEWYLVTERGRIPKKSPVMETWDGAMAIHDLVEERLGRRIFVIPVLAFPDMEPDEFIRERAAARKAEDGGAVRPG